MLNRNSEDMKGWDCNEVGYLVVKISILTSITRLEQLPCVSPRRSCLEILLGIGNMNAELLRLWAIQTFHSY